MVVELVEVMSEYWIDPWRDVKIDHQLRSLSTNDQALLALLG